MQLRSVITRGMTTERHYQRCLRHELAERLQKNPRYSLRAFARSLQIDPGTLSRILSGRKVLTPELSRKVLRQISLSPKETENFLHSMAKAYEEEGVQRKKSEIKEILKKKAPLKVAERDLTPDVFRIISDWYHYAILQLVQEEDCLNDPKWIAGQLGIQEMEAKLAIDRLLELELLHEEKDKEKSRLIRTNERLTTGDLSVTTAALKKRIKQVSEKSVHSLENDLIALRSHTTMTMAIDPEKLPVAKEMIQEFMDRLAAVLQTKKKKVYELQINLFPLQRSEK